MIIDRITSKDVNTKFGPKKSYSIQAGGKWVSYGLKKPVFNEGDDVEFSVVTNAAGYEGVDVATVRVISKGAGTPPAAPATAVVAPSKPSYGPPAKVFPIPPLHGDRAIVRQNSLTNAVNLLKEHIEFDGDMVKTAEFVVSIARVFEAYSCGDMDYAAAMKDAE
jgi:hypothetical protein